MHQAFNSSPLKLAGFTALFFIGMSLNGWCQQPSGQTPAIYDRVWDAATFYENPENTSLQKFALIGRYHGQYWSVNADQGNDSDWENRRMIVGFSSKWFENFTLQAQMHLKSGSGSIYDGLYEAYIKWVDPDSGLSVSAGRLDYLFTGYERSKSSKKITTIERGLLVNQVMPAEVIGVHMRGQQGRFSYHAGLFSRSIEEEFDDFDTGAAAVAGAAYDTPLFLENGRLQLDYLYNSRDTEGNAFRPYRHVVSLWHQGEKGRLTMAMDLTYADPLETSGHVIGLTLEPAWRLLDQVFGKNDPLQFTLRYQYANSSEDNGLRLQKRYEGKVTEGNGDHYQALYAGLDYFLYDHKFKLMLGGEYARMKDTADDGGEYRGWSWFAAVRLYF